MLDKLGLSIEGLFTAGKCTWDCFSIRREFGRVRIGDRSQGRLRLSSGLGFFILTLITRRISVARAGQVQFYRSARTTGTGQRFLPSSASWCPIQGLFWAVAFAVGAFLFIFYIALRNIALIDWATGNGFHLAARSSLRASNPQRASDAKNSKRKTRGA